MCVRAAGPWDRDLALLADGEPDRLRPSGPVCREASGPGEAREGGSASGRREGVTGQKQGMELVLVHRLSGGRWTGQAGWVLRRAVWVLLPAGRKSAFVAFPQ